MFSWLGELLAGMGDALGASFSGIGKEVVQVIFDTMLQWLYTAIYDAIAAFFAQMGSMGAEIFSLSWVSATTKLFSMFGWALFSCGLVIAVFETAIEYQNGRGNIQATALNVLKGFFAASLVGTLPVELYKFCISLQFTFARDLTRIFAGEQTVDLSALALNALTGKFLLVDGEPLLITLLALLAFGYCVVKIFFANIKRGGILLVEIAVGSLYLYGVPRGYIDGFSQWCKQVIALCLTAFLQTTLLFLGLLTFPDNMLMALGIMLAAGEVPRVAQQFGMDSSVKVNMMSVIHATNTAVNLSRSVLAAAR